MHKHFRRMLVAASLLGAISSAQAADYQLGALTEGYNDFGPNAVAIGNFLDKIYFQLAQASNSDFGAGPLNFTLRGVPHREVSNMSMSLFDQGDVQLGNGLDFSVNGLDGGSYYLRVSGNATGTAGGLYAGSINVTSLPVPEPGVGSSLFAGLLMLAFMTARRRNT